MNVYLVRHGEAEEGADDSSRVLSERGREDVRKVADHLGKQHIVLKRIYHSGKTRARQTAEIFAEYMNPEQGVSQTDGLAPTDSPEIWQKKSSGTAEDILLVGHLPHLGKLASSMLCGSKEKNVITFAAGGALCMVRSEDDMWSLQWLLTPSIL
jgi:phosphohistidine phosphatase